MSRRLFQVAVVCLTVLLMSNCVKLSKTSHETEDVIVNLGRGVIEVTAKRDLTAVEIWLSFSTKKTQVNYSGQLLGIHYSKDNGTVLVLAGTTGNIRKGTKICLIDSNLETLQGVEITSKGIILSESYGIASKDPLPNDICVVDSFVRSNTDGSFLIHGKNVAGIHEIDLEIEYDSEFLSLRTDEGIQGVVPAGNFIGGSHEVIHSSGRVGVSSRFTSGVNLEDEDFLQVLIRTQDISGKTTIAITGEATNTKGQTFRLVYTNGRLDIGEPILLGDFNGDGKVNLTDLGLFTQRYGQKSGDSQYSILYDIGPAEDYYGGVWDGFLDRCDSDGEIGLGDFLVFTKNYGKSLPEESNHAPSSPSSPFPANSEVDLPLTVSLIWKCSDVDKDALTYDVFFGTSASPPLVKLRNTSPVYRLPALEFGTDYYWKIIAYDGKGGISEGPLWTFRTKNRPSKPDIAWQKCIGTSGSDGLKAIEPLPNGGFAIAGFAFFHSCNAWLGELLLDGTLRWSMQLYGEGLDIATAITPEFWVLGYTWSGSSDFYWIGGGEYSNSYAIKMSAEELTLGARVCSAALGGNRDDYIYDYDGGAFAGATYSSEDPYVNRGGSDLWIGLFSNYLDWHATFGGSKDDVAYGVCRTDDGLIVAAGVTFSNDGDVTGNHGMGDVWVIKVDPDKGLVWQRCLGGSDYDAANAIRSTADGGSIVAGVTCSNDGDVSGNKGNADAWVVKLGINGEIEWQKCLGGSAYDEAFDILQTPDGGYVVAALTYSNDQDVTGYRGGGDIWVVKLDAIGRIVWQYCLGGSSLDQPARMALSKDNGVVIVGSTLSNDGDVSGNNGGMDMWVVKLLSQ